MGNASVAEEIAVGAKGESEEPLKREKADIASQVKVWVKKKGTIDESGAKIGHLPGSQLYIIFEGG